MANVTRETCRERGEGEGGKGRNEGKGGEAGRERSEREGE